MEPNKEIRIPPTPRVTPPPVKWILDEGIINGVITKAVWSEGQRPGIWQDMIYAINHGAAGTEGGTVNEFLFQAMVDRLVEEFHKMESE